MAERQNLPEVVRIAEHCVVLMEGLMQELADFEAGREIDTVVVEIEDVVDLDCTLVEQIHKILAVVEGFVGFE